MCINFKIFYTYVDEGSGKSIYLRVSKPYYSQNNLMLYGFCCCQWKLREKKTSF